jgi:hypothetical protein
MRKAAIVLGVIGGLVAAVAGLVLLHNDSEALDLAKQMGLPLDPSLVASDQHAAYSMFLALALGIGGAIAALRGNAKLGGGLMLVGVVIPAFFKGGSLLFTSVLAIGGILALLAKPRSLASA